MSEVQTYVWLNGQRLLIIGPITWRRITPFPDRFSTSAPTEADYTPTRKQRWGSLRGGMGKEKWTPEDNDRYWSSSGVDASQEVQTLAPLVTTLGSFGKEPVKIIKHAGKIWAIGHNQISFWTGSAWTSKKTDFGNPTDAILYYGVS